MDISWKKIIHNVAKLRDVSTIGITDTVASAISAVFWFYMAALLGAEQYGEISYFLAIAGLASSLAMLGSDNVFILLQVFLDLLLQL